MDPIKRKPKKGTKNNPVKKGEVTVKPKTGYVPNQYVSKWSYDKKGSPVVLRTTGTNYKGKRDWINTLTPTNQKMYSAKYGIVDYSTSKFPNKSSIVSKPDFRKSIDTTGYAAGKKTFTINSIKRKEGELAKTKSVKIPRSKVMGTLDKWKSAASKMTPSKKTVAKPNSFKNKKSNG